MNITTAPSPPRRSCRFSKNSQCLSSYFGSSFHHEIQPRLDVRARRHQQRCFQAGVFDSADPCTKTYKYVCMCSANESAIPSPLPARFLRTSIRTAHVIPKSSTPASHPIPTPHKEHVGDSHALRMGAAKVDRDILSRTQWEAKTPQHAASAESHPCGRTSANP